MTFVHLVLGIELLLELGDLSLLGSGEVLGIVSTHRLAGTSFPLPPPFPPPSPSAASLVGCLLEFQSSATNATKSAAGAATTILEDEVVIFPSKPSQNFNIGININFLLLYTQAPVK